MITYKYTLSFPLCCIGVMMLVLGIRWLIHPEPWMLDEIANVERLGMTFEQLFKPVINATLPGYLQQIYRFFGFWVFIIGLMILSFSLPNSIIKLSIGNKIISIVGLMMAFGMYLGYALIPSSHFITLMWFLIGLYLISLYSHIKIHKH